MVSCRRKGRYEDGGVRKSGLLWKGWMDEVHGASVVILIVFSLMVWLAILHGASGGYNLWLSWRELEDI